MTLTVSGTAAAAEHAFGVALHVFRGARDGRSPPPPGAIRLPAAIAGAVQTVGGLDTSVRLRPAIQPAQAAPAAAAITPSCSRRDERPSRRSAATCRPTSASARAYGHNSLIASGADGSGELIGMVEFSGYARSDVNHFRSCFPGITGGYPADAIVGAAQLGHERQERGRARPRGGDGGRARRRRARVRRAQRPGFAPAMLDRMRQDGVDVISDSWGACEPLIPPQLLTAENTALELAAVAGISTYVATGDFGSTDCFPFTGSTNLLIDDPSSQPFATAVGGTALEMPPVFPERQREGVARLRRRHLDVLGASPPTSAGRPSRGRAQVPQREGPVP